MIELVADGLVVVASTAVLVADEIGELVASSELASGKLVVAI